LCCPRGMELDLLLNLLWMMSSLPLSMLTKALFSLLSLLSVQ
ncbi:hypothetical protein HMPREF1614_02751, partial [Escherichia coli 908624]